MNGRGMWTQNRTFQYEGENEMKRREKRTCRV